METDAFWSSTLQGVEGRWTRFSGGKVFPFAHKTGEAFVIQTDEDFQVSLILVVLGPNIYLQTCGLS
jgi:hypothetical protein